jgi:PRTRC genetic system protein B
MLYLVEKGIITQKMVSAREVALAFMRNTPMKSRLLPKDTMWWEQGRYGLRVAIWKSPRVWPVALKKSVTEPPERFKLPMPGLIFICSPGMAPAVFATKRRPESPGTMIYRAPLFNVFDNGSTCPGSNKYPQNVSEIPESFFLSFFTMEASYENRSVKHPDSLYALWKELDGEKKYPLNDLVPCGKVGDILT